MNVLSVCASVEYSAKPDIGSYRVVSSMIAHTAYIILLGNCTRWPIPVVVGIKYYVVRRFRAQCWGQTNVDDSVFGRQKAFNMPLLHLSVNHPHLCEEYDLLLMSYVFEVTTAQGAVFSQLCVYYDNSTSSVCPTVRPQTQHHQLGFKTLSFVVIS